MKAKLHVAIIHDSKIPALKYGGTERIVYWLGQALHELGHEVTFIVPEGSTSTFGNLVFRPQNDPSVNSIIPASVDIVHSFSTLHEKLTKPLIVTIEGNGQPGEKFHPNTIFISKNHADRHNGKIFVYNGLNPTDYGDFDPEIKEPYTYFLAKAKWKVKNVKGAIEISKKAKLPIKIMGGRGISFNRNVKWLGMLGGEEKINILKRGSALLFPVRWHEPFGIAIIEALLTGSPVFGTPYGSLPELVPPEVGFLSTNSNEIAGKLKNYKEYKPETCRNYILNKFTHIHMAKEYLNYYEDLINGKMISKDEPFTISKSHPETLQPFEY